MTRSGYTDDWDSESIGRLNLYRGAVERAVKGKRGQELLRDLVEALDSLPEKRLITSELEDGLGSYCALGAVAHHRGVDVSDLDPYDDIDVLAKRLDVAESMVREVVHLNDEVVWDIGAEAQSKRWHYMRRWAEREVL